jgi:hypothetical protein
MKVHQPHWALISFSIVVQHQPTLTKPTLKKQSNLQGELPPELLQFNNAISGENAV